MQHDGIRLTGSGRLSIRSGAVTMLLDQRVISNVCIAKGVLIIAEIIGSQKYSNHIRLFSGSIVQLYAALLIGTCRARSGGQHAASAPGIVHQKIHTQQIYRLLPPGIPTINALRSCIVIHGTTRQSGVDSAIIGYACKCGNTVTQN